MYAGRPVTSDNGLATDDRRNSWRGVEHGWRVTARCALGNRDGMKSIRECHNGFELDLQTLIWTRGRGFPLSSLQARLRCPRCGSREVRLLYNVPTEPGRLRSGVL
jgi:hypothetical protein